MWLQSHKPPVTLWCSSVYVSSVSHFCAGRTQLGQMKLTIFRYCKPTPYLGWADTGLYKRMRWNVERLGDQLQSEDRDDEEDVEEETHTD